MKTPEQLLNNVIGQLGGVGKMIADDQDAFAVLTQMKAARSALNNAMNSYIQEHFWEFMRECDDKEDACKRFLAELLSN
ncbi:MAG: hypothetical protein TR69_WS6001001528 [candidate division WS6 bacterium OLB20]|uniref:Copper-sensing transcriptional repressor CsoR n=1 Tax=candidate division WS6 bacterium OLB20 TaxID=1617426 RepID=A0A136LVQ7_9BACT|nr:MAG: hypothetical protein TR69_WS6001001528 [candidate division WS6 bacterium OLB20]